MSHSSHPFIQEPILQGETPMYLQWSVLVYFLFKKLKYQEQKKTKKKNIIWGVDFETKQKMAKQVNLMLRINSEKSY